MIETLGFFGGFVLVLEVFFVEGVEVFFDDCFVLVVSLLWVDVNF